MKELLLFIISLLLYYKMFVVGRLIYKTEKQVRELNLTLLANDTLVLADDNTNDNEDEEIVED